MVYMIPDSQLRNSKSVKGGLIHIQTRMTPSILTMYIGDPHSVAAIISPGRNLAKPKSAEDRITKLLFCQYLDFNTNYSFVD